MGCPEIDKLSALVNGQLEAGERAGVEDHVSSCNTCSARYRNASAAGRTTAGAGEEAPQGAAQAAPAPPPAPGAGSGALQRGTVIGRYVVLELVGRGGMGEVYAAYDPQLDRKIALKILTAQPGGGETLGRARMLREAKSLARLSHPNVVILHDAGETDAHAAGDRVGVHVFLAMEFVDGETLETWLKREPRSWRAIREVALAAARGLAAAHDAGLVHRDFKPQNVMVGRDGTVRVMDFGIARDAAARDGETPPATAEREANSDDALRLTRTGALLGTPLYMAPEQFAERRADARTDQFAFCVALYQAFYGQRPFPSDNLLQLAEAVTNGRVLPVPPRSPVPAELHRAILRGLSPRPEARFPTMGALIEALGYDPARRRRRRIAVTALAALLLLVGAGARWNAGRGARLCRVAGAPMAEVWDAASGRQRGALERSFLATGAAFAKDTAARVAATLDRYAARWTAASEDACAATHVRGEQSAHDLDLRRSCLRRSLSALRALTGSLASASTDAVAESVERAYALPPIERCADLVALRSAPPLPEDPGARRRVEALQDRLATVAALRRSGKWTEARGQVGPLLDEARATRHEPLVAEVTFERGALESTMGDTAAAVSTLRSAFLSAVVARRDDLALSAATQLLATLGYGLGRHDEARTWDDLAGALLERLGAGHERDTAALQMVRAMNAEAHGDFTSAIASTERAIALTRAADLAEARGRDALDGYGVGILWDNLANQRLEAHDLAGALAASDEGIAIGLRVHGPEHPTRGIQLSNRGEIVEALGRHAEAKATFEEALRIMRTFVPPDDPQLAYPMTGLGNALRGLGRAREAVDLLEAALALRVRGDRRPQALADAQFALAQARWETGARPRARALAREALAAYRAAAWTRQAAQVESWRAAHP